jgi:hypothetical protein
MKIGDLVEGYSVLVSQLAEMERVHKAAVEPYKKLIARAEAEFLRYLNESGQQQIKTPDATIFTKTVDYANVEDPEKFLQFCIETDNFDLLERRCSKTAVRQYIEDNKVVPNGINYGTKLSLNIRLKEGKK